MIIRVQINGKSLNPITLAPYIKGEKGDKGDPGTPANSISSDPQNAARLGSDGGIFVPVQSGMGAESDILNAIIQGVFVQPLNE